MLLQRTLASSLGRLGRAVLAPVVTATMMGRLLLTSLASPLGQRRAAQRTVLASTVEQLRSMGIQALSPVLWIGFGVGMLGAIQLLDLLGPLLGNAEVWPLLMTILLRELAPLLTAIVLAGKAGTVMASDVARMNASDELDALRTMGVNPHHHVLLPRIVAMVASALSLGFFFLFAAIVGGGFVARFSLSLPTFLYLDYVLDSIAPFDVALFLLKVTVFGLITAVVAAVRGLQVERTAEAIPRAVSVATIQSLGGCVLVDALFGVLFY